MSTIQSFLKEMQAEAAVTRKMLSRVPDDKLDWKPHEKSMNIRQLATHIAELPSWASLALTTNELDFAKEPYTPTPVSGAVDLLKIFDKCLTEAQEHLNQTNEKVLTENWTLRSGDQVHMVFTKAETIRHAFCQTVHHRAQLGVYFRLLNIPVPATYGPSADEGF